jgi:hypothetical protein
MQKRGSASDGEPRRLVGVEFTERELRALEAAAAHEERLISQVIRYRLRRLLREYAERESAVTA